MGNAGTAHVPQWESGKVANPKASSSQDSIRFCEWEVQLLAVRAQTNDGTKPPNLLPFGPGPTRSPAPGRPHATAAANPQPLAAAASHEQAIGDPLRSPARSDQLSVDRNSRKLPLNHLKPSIRVCFGAIQNAFCEPFRGIRPGPLKGRH